LVIETLRALDVFMPNASEALHLTQTTSLEAAADVLLRYVSRLVIKDGARGAQAWWDNQHFQHAALTLTPLDTTGAGDVFNAGFLAAYHSGQPIPICLQWGNIAGGLSTQGYGGCSTAPHLAELQAHLSA
jgi:sugar/nucleoside kinase (ribokinase family)